MHHKAIIWYICLFFLIISSPLFSQEITGFGNEARGKEGIRMVFYNLENLFDIEDDSLKNDDEFTPQGDKHWTWERYQEKLRNHSQTFTAIGGWEAPEIIAVCEIENEKVLKGLTEHSILKDWNYQIAHIDSPDKRGVDVGLLYRPDKIEVLEYEALTVKFSIENTRPTRDVLHVKALILETDTLHIFINHWPSRYGGMAASQPKRLVAAKVVRKRVDEIFKINPQANIIITGDFNDEPENKSITDVLNAKHEEETLADSELFNLMYEKLGKVGTHKFNGEWGILDQFIVSTALLEGQHKLKITNDRAQVFQAEWLLVDETRYMGKKPFRTYQGPKFLGGYSDHLPIYLDIGILTSNENVSQK